MISLVSRFWRAGRRLYLKASYLALLSLFTLTPFTITKLQAQEPSVRSDMFAFGPDGYIRVENLCGATRVGSWGDQKIHVIAEKKASAGKPFEPSELVISKSGNVVSIRCGRKDHPDRIDVTIYIPKQSHLQVTGTRWPVEVTGSLRSAVVETTSGNIEYLLPPSDDAQVAMRSARGAVRSGLALTGYERAGARIIQGRLGKGIAPIILSSTSGDISLGPAPAIQRVASVVTRTPAGSQDAPTPRSQNPDPVYDRGGPNANARTGSSASTGTKRQRPTRPDPSSASGYDAQKAPPPADERQAEIELDRPRPTAPPTLIRGDVGQSPGPVAAALASAGAPGEEAVVLKTSLVSLNVGVTDRSGKGLHDLRREDLLVFEDGQPQDVKFFAPTSAPFNLVLLMDLSGSIADKIDVVKSAALRFLDVIGPQDRVAVLVFTREVQVISPLTTDRDLLRERITNIERPRGGTAFYEAVWFALNEAFRGTQGQRNALVVMTDGVDSSLERSGRYAPTRVSFERLARRLEEADVMAFPIYIDTEEEVVWERMAGTAMSYEVARSQLAHMAELTGGQMFQARRADDLSRVYDQVAAALRTVYSVGYYPTNQERDGTFRRVRVRVNREGAVARTRKGYYLN